MAGPEKLQKVAYFLGALAHGAETNLGRSCLSLCSMAGKRLGQQAVEDVAQTEDPFEAVERLAQALGRRGMLWDFAPFAGEAPSAVQTGSQNRMRLVFRSCMVRCALFAYGHEQRQSLCYIAHGVFAGAMERVMPGASVHLDILHAGPNACLKEMRWEVRR